MLSYNGAKVLISSILVPPVPNSLLKSSTRFSKLGSIITRHNSNYLVRKSPLKLGIQNAPFELGQRKHGVSQGPKVLRDTKFIDVLQQVVGIDVKDYGDIQLEAPDTNERTNLPNLESHAIRQGDVALRNPKDVAVANQRIYESTVKIIKDGRFCLTLGGDHSIAMGTICGSAELHDNLGVIWVDAHADVNTSLTTASGNMHGMPVAFLIKEMDYYHETIPGFSWLKPCISAKDFVYIGLRDVEPYEKSFLNLLGIKAFSMADVDQLGINEVISSALKYLTSDLGRSRHRPIHVSFDVDALDDLEIPCTGTPVPGGLSLREGMHVVETIFSSTNFVSMDLVEFNPALGSQLEVQRTAKAIKEIIFSSFGYDRGGMPVLCSGGNPADPPVPNKSKSGS